jgi:GNAT superfamily N-acetyltransferase
VGRYGPVELLTPAHETDAFDCGSEAQSTWVRRHALQAHRSDTCRVYVVCRRGESAVVGYYALAAGSVSHETAPSRMLKGVGRYPVPVILLTRLGVDRAEQGRGLGSALVQDALRQAVAVSDRVGVRALLIHCEGPRASDFYRRIDSEFEQSPTDPLQLLLLRADLREAVSLAGGFPSDR